MTIEIRDSGTGLSVDFAIEECDECSKMGGL
jgi:hypothetical protein